MKGVLYTAWLASMGLVTWRSFAQQQRPPLPSELAASFIVYGTLSLFSGQAEAPAAMFGWGLVVAGFLNIVPGIANLNTPGSTIGQAGQTSQTAAGKG